MYIYIWKIFYWVCELITIDTKIRVLVTTEQDQELKVSNFFERMEDMFNKIKWQKKIRGQPMLLYVIME